MSNSDDVRIRIAGITVVLTAFLTGKDDPTIGGVSVLSRPREWHALGVGFVAVVAPSLIGLSPTVAAGGGGLYVLGRQVRAWADSDTLHLRDAAEEPAYFALGYAGTHVLDAAAEAANGVVA